MATSTSFDAMTFKDYDKFISKTKYHTYTSKLSKLEGECLRSSITGPGQVTVAMYGSSHPKIHKQGVLM